MYETTYNISYLVNGTGTNSTIDHQIIIRKLTVDLGNLHYYQKTLRATKRPQKDYSPD